MFTDSEVFFRIKKSNPWIPKMKKRWLTWKIKSSSCLTINKLQNSPPWLNSESVKFVIYLFKTRTRDCFSLYLAFLEFCSRVWRALKTDELSLVITIFKLTGAWAEVFFLLWEKLPPHTQVKYRFHVQNFFRHVGKF